MKNKILVSLVENHNHDIESTYNNVKVLLQRLNIFGSNKALNKVLIKVNMACTGSRLPEQRFTTHPALVEAVIRYFQDNGSDVFFGDDAARAGRFYKRIWEKTGMLDVAQRTGARLLDFVVPGAREVKSTLLYPRKYLVSNAYFEYDYIVNLANCRSHTGVFLSGAIKNMFGFVVGQRKFQIHQIFRDNIKGFCKTIANIHSRIPADLSILDLTSVLEGKGLCDKVVDVGYILASTDPVCLDSLAARIIGYEDQKIWLIDYAAKFGIGSKVGSKDQKHIEYLGKNPDEIETRQLKLPKVYQSSHNLKNIFLRLYTRSFHPVVKINYSKCRQCLLCIERCPVNAIQQDQNSFPFVQSKTCAKCMCCVRVCEYDAFQIVFSPMISMVRSIFGKSSRINMSEDREKEFGPNAFNNVKKCVDETTAP